MRTEVREEVDVTEYRETAQVKEKGVLVYVIMPLDSITMGNTVNRRKTLNASLQVLNSAAVEGIMMDVWWGLVERSLQGSKVGEAMLSSWKSPRSTASRSRLSCPFNNVAAKSPILARE